MTVLKNIRVLVVDDSSDARDVLQAVLEREGAVVSTAGSARQALAQLDKLRLDVMLVDIGMPIVNGFTLIEQIRLRPLDEGGAIPIAALTGYISTVDRDRAQEAGAEAYLIKPVEPADLIETVRSLGTRTPLARPSPPAGRT